jgi:hypothetical protein
VAAECAQGGRPRYSSGAHLRRRAPEVVETSAAGSLLARLSPPERAYSRLAEKLAVLEIEEELPGFGRRGRLSEPA